MTPTIRAATAADLDAIDRIEQHAFPRPWPRATFEAELATPHARIDVAVDAHDRAIAFHDYWLVAGELHVLAIATDPDRRRAGLGRALLEHALAAARAGGATLATLEVRRGNAPAIALYLRCGFAVAHVRARYYQDNDEDALVMIAPLSVS